MKNRIITINDNEVISIPSKVRMTIMEIADLFGIHYQTVKKNIRDIEKSGITSGDYSLSCTVDGKNIYPEYYGLNMIIAVAFRAQSPKAELFREWIMKKILRNDITTTLVLPLQNTLLN